MRSTAGRQNGQPHLPPVSAPKPLTHSPAMPRPQTPSLTATATATTPTAPDRAAVGSNNSLEPLKLSNAKPPLPSAARTSGTPGSTRPASTSMKSAAVSSPASGNEGCSPMASAPLLRPSGPGSARTPTASAKGAALRVAPTPAPPRASKPPLPLVHAVREAPAPPQRGQPSGSTTPPSGLTSSLLIPMVAVTGTDSKGQVAELSSAAFDEGSVDGNSSRTSGTAGAARLGGQLALPAPHVGDSLSIVTVETPTGVDAISSSSSSTEPLALTARSGVMTGRTAFLLGGSGGLTNAMRSVGPQHDSFSEGTRDDNLTPNLMPLLGDLLRSFDGNMSDDCDLHSDGGAGLHLGVDDEDDDCAGRIGGNGQGVRFGERSGKGSGFGARGAGGMAEDNSHNGLATFFNRPKVCHSCDSSAVGYACDQCTSFYLCENCRFDEHVLARHDRTHRIVPLHETHCNTSRTFGGSSSMGTIEGGSSLFYNPCSLCGKVIDDTEPVHRCEVCDYIVCESCHTTKPVDHPHDLRRFQRRTRNGSVTEGMLLKKSRTDEGNRIINDYAVVKLLGQGSFAKVKLVQNIRTRKLYALKILRKARRSQSNLLSRSRTRQSDEDLLREIAVMKFVDHPNIVKLIEVIDDIDGGKVYVIMEYCAKGPVHVHGDPVLSVNDVRRFGVGILAGLLHMHNEFLYHRDVKPANCLVDDQNVVKIADFGTCNSRVRASAVEGTPAFTCPEQSRGEEVSGDVSDSWAFALTLYQMAYGLLPCDRMLPLQYQAFLSRSDPIPVPPDEARQDAGAAAAVHDAHLTDLLKKMLSKDVSQRMLLSAAAYHPFFKLSSVAAKQLVRPPVPFDVNDAGSPGAAKGDSVVTTSPAPPAPPAASQSSSPSHGSGRRRGSPARLAPVKPAQPSAPHPARRSFASISNSLSDNSVPARTPATARREQFFDKALQEVRRGKNLTEAFYGVKSIRRVRRKDVNNADNNADAERDDGSDGDASSRDATGAIPKRGYAFPPREGGSRRGSDSADSLLLSTGGDAGPAPRRRSGSLMSDAAFDMAAILDLITQQGRDKSDTLELVRLKMHSVPSAANNVAGITANLRFTMNSLLSVASVRFDQFSLLKDVAITSNQLKRFPEEVLKAPRLLRLDLSHNCIVSLPATLAKARFLERLNLHGNNICAVGVDPRTGTSVLAAPSLHHVRLSANPLEALPQNLTSTQGIEVVLDANPTVMKEWHALVDSHTQRGHALPAVVIWDDYFPVRIPGCAFDIWMASGDLSLYRAHTLKTCDTPYVVLLSAADARFPRGGAMTSAALGQFLDAEAARQAPRGGKPSEVPQPSPHPVPAVISKEARAFVKSYFFVSDDVEDPEGGFNALLDFLITVLVQQRDIFAEKGIQIGEDVPVVAPLSDGGGGRATRGPAKTEGGLRATSGKGVMLVLMNRSELRDVRELAVAALSDALCRMSNGFSEERLKMMFEAVMEAMRSLYA